MESTDMASAFEAEAGTTPVVNVSGVDASTVTSKSEPVNDRKFYTEDDLAKVRSQEKDKLYPEIERLKEELLLIKKEKEERAAIQAAEEAEKLARAKEAAESDLEVRDLLKIKEQEWQEQLERERQERERAFALLEQERKFVELQTYRQGLVEQERDNIIPELVDLISGNTPEEISSSVESLKERSARILESAQTAMQTARKEMIGTRATLPPAGPLETNSEQRSLTADEISAMPMNEYAKYRPRILSESALGKGRGLFG
jgi:hypothetical protein